jgi:DHA1 family multidrug resistance protein-like MFS transporter
MAPLFVLGLLEFVRQALVISLIPLYGQFVGGFNLTTIGTAIFLLYLLDILFRLPAGWLTDRLGGKLVISGGIVISSLGILLMYLYWNNSFFMLGSALFGLGIAPLWPAVISEVTAKLSLHNIGEALSKVFIAWLVGAGSGMIVINYIIGHSSYGLSFAVLLGVMALALLLTISSDLPRVYSKEILPTAIFLKELGKELLHLKILYPGMFVQTMCIGIMTPVIAIYARTVFGFSADQFAYFLISGGALTVLLLVPGGKLADRLGVKRPLITGFSLATIGLVLLPLQRIASHAMFIGALIGISYALILPAWNGLIARVVSREKMGTMWAIFMTIEGMGMAIGAYVGGQVWDNFGPQTPFWVCAFILGSMVIFYSSVNIDKLVLKFSHK